MDRLYPPVCFVEAGIQSVLSLPEDSEELGDALKHVALDFNCIQQLIPRIIKRLGSL